MRLEGYPGLAVAIMKQAAHDYCEALRWMRDNAEPGVHASEIVRKQKELRDEWRSKREYGEAKRCSNLITYYSPQAEREETIAEIEEWFGSHECHMISEIDGESFLERIQEQLKKDPKFRVLLGDDI